MKTELAEGIEVRPSLIDGKGCFATAPFRKGRKIAEMTGELVSRVEAARRMRGRRRIRICAINPYWGVDGSRGGNGMQYVNHSCTPNTFMRIIHGHVIFFALRDIAPGEELTLDYVNSYHPDSYRCRCKSPGCRGSLNLVKRKQAGRPAPAKGASR